MKNFRILPLLCGLLFLAGCGDLFMGKEEKTKMSQLLSCSTDPSALSHIFTRNIKGDLHCLEESLNLFVQVVESKQPGKLGYNELTAFINKNMENVDQSIFTPLEGFFEINSLLSGDDPHYIKKENIGNLMEMLVLINDVMVKNKVYEYFTEDEPQTYQEHVQRKANIFNAFSAMEQALQGFFKNNDNKLDLVAFIKKFENVDNSEILKGGEKLLFIKKMFLGGDKKTLTAKELRRLMLMLAEASKIAYDMVQLGEVDHSVNDKEEIMIALKEDIETVSRNLYVNPLVNEPLVTLDDLYFLAENHFPALASMVQYEDAILQAKRILLDNDSPFFTGEELKTLFDEIALKNLQRGIFFFKAYAANNQILDAPRPIKLDLPNVIATSDLEEEFKEDFNRIARDYWFFVDSNWVASYQTKLRRSPWGMFITATLEDIVTRAFAHYVDKTEGAYGGYKMPRAKIQTLLEDFKSFLNGQEIILPGREVNAAETIELMSALFQKQSDGNGDDIEVNEMVELLTTMISGFTVSDRFYEEVTSECRVDYKGRFSPECLKAHFASVFDTQVKEGEKTFGQYFPKLAQYVRSLSPSENEAFVNKMSVFTRACMYFDDGEPVPVSKGDVFMFFAGLLNMESTYSVFDQGGSEDGSDNNILEVSELNRAYDEVYRQAIEAKVPKLLRWRSKDVFFYLLDKGKEPSALTMLLRIVPAGYPKKTADRDSVASVLKVISEGSEANQNNPFDCETLR